MACVVVHRTREIGIRVALGARASGILSLVFGRGLLLTGLGMLGGIAAALALTRVLSTLLFGATASAPATFAAVASHRPPCGRCRRKCQHSVGTRMKTLLVAGAVALISSQAFAQTPDSMSALRAQPHDAATVDASLATPTGHEVNVSLGGYTYVEPNAPSISIHGAKVGGEYTGTLSLDRRRHWFAQADVRGTAGNVTYDGWCSPFLITPNSASPNGYELDVGDPSPCSETGDRDWYVETRGLVGKDFIVHKWALSPHAGLGFRHLSNGTTGIPGYRTDDYLYLPFGMTARTRVASHSALSFNLEYDHLIHGWQTTRDSELGGGDVPATTTAPGFTIDGFTDISFAQHGGWALRASAKYQATTRWSVEPYYVHWNVSASPVSHETATFTVNAVTAHEQFGAYEPWNVTHEFGVNLGLHF